MHNYASSRKTVVKLIHESPQRSYSYFGITTLEESDSRARNKQNPFFLLLYLSSLSFFLHQHGTHNQHTNSLSGTLPSLRLSPCASLYPTEKKRNAMGREEASQSHQRSTKSPLFSDSAIFRERRLRSARPFARFCTPDRPGKHINRCRE